MYKIDFNHPAHVYFVGIGGISMSGLALVLHHAGFQVSGSDWKASDVTSSLEAAGINVMYGENASHVTPDIDCAVLTSAVKDTNLEFQAIKSLNIPWITRAQLLGQLMQNYPTSIAVSGTHGKTTTTSIVSEILLRTDLDPTLSVGGILKSIGGNIRIGSGPCFVTEACEYTNSFLSLHPTIGIILNIEEDHLDFFQDLAQIRSSFRRFAQLIPAHGCLIINADIPDYQEIVDGLSCRIITYSVSDSSAHYYSENISYNTFGCATFTQHAEGQPDRVFSLKVPGLHNVGNAMAAVALADYLDIPGSIIAGALDAFTGTDRRFEYKGTVGGVTVIDDYAHHPTEITATLTTAGHYPHNTIWCVFQPHTYTRTKAFMDDFSRALSLADKVVLADIYAARETDTLGISSSDLQTLVQNRGKECYYFPSFDEIENFLLENCIKGDLLITMGAGDVHKIGENLLGI